MDVCTFVSGLLIRFEVHAGGCIGVLPIGGYLQGVKIPFSWGWGEFLKISMLRITSFRHFEQNVRLEVTLRILHFCFIIIALTNIICKYHPQCRNYGQFSAPS